MRAESIKELGSFIRRSYKKLYGSIWFFPVILLIPLILLTSLQISGSSIGAFRQILYGKSGDTNLLLNSPESIRSDEWLVNTQMTLSQAKNGFHRINPNIGNGEDVSLMADVPYKEWSEVFRPQNLAYFVMPLQNAFAFKWWFIGFLLITSCYLFILALLPKRRMLAAILSTALFFSAFVQWWYSYGTLSPLYYSLFIATACIYLARQTVLWKKLALGAAIAYLVGCFALVLYPPFQIACGLVLGAFLVGYVLENYTNWGKRKSIELIAIVGGSMLVGLAFVGLFLVTRPHVVHSITNTAYPGKRIIKSGDVKVDHFLSSQLGHQFLSDTTTAYYKIDNKNPTNQSEGSNFLQIAPFLFVPAVLLLAYDYRRKRKIDWPLLLQCALFVVFMLQLFVPAFTPFAKFLLLQESGTYRALIGIGLLNIMMMVLFIRNMETKRIAFPRRAALLYTGLVLAVELAVNLHAHFSFGEFVGIRRALMYAIPIPLIVYLFLRKRFVVAVAIYLLFSLFIAGRVNPLYKGLSTVTDNPLSTAIKTLGAHSDKRWASDGGYLENMAAVNGERSLSGVYDYPQFTLWDKIPNAPQKTYNRYAHVGVQVSDDPATKTQLKLIGGDSFVVQTYVCSNYLKQEDVGFVVTSAVLQNPCITLQKTLTYPIATLYIYSIN